MNNPNLTLRLTISEIREKKKKLHEQLFSCLQEFTKETGLVIEELDYRFAPDTVKSTNPYREARISFRLENPF